VRIVKGVVNRRAKTPALVSIGGSGKWRRSGKPKRTLNAVKYGEDPTPRTWILATPG
jgi:hypothetical protein